MMMGQQEYAGRITAPRHVEGVTPSMQLVSGTCCGRSWVGDERSHCCVRTRGCGEVFDDVELFDSHRIVGCCVSPWVMGLVQTKNRIWLRVLDGEPG
jgi:hypothetical protein